MVGNKFFYLRVSDADKSEEMQIKAINDKGIIIEEKKYVFVEKHSNNYSERYKYHAMKVMLQEGDTLFIKNIDLLGVTYLDIVEEWEDINKNKKVDIVVLDIPLLDTRKYKELAGTLISDIFLQILNYVVVKERISIKQRQRDGIDTARAEGTRFGRPRIEIEERFTELFSKWKVNEITAVEFMRLVGLKKNTFYRRIKEYENKLKDDSSS